MSRHRKSLSEIAREDDMVSEESTVSQNTASVPLTPANSSHGATKQKPESTAAVSHPSEIRNPKSDYVKMTITVPPQMFEQIQDLSRARRRAKKPYTMSDLAREAFSNWLSAQAE